MHGNTMPNDPITWAAWVMSKPCGYDLYDFIDKNHINAAGTYTSSWHYLKKWIRDNRHWLADMGMITITHRALSGFPVEVRYTDITVLSPDILVAAPGIYSYEDLSCEEK